MRVRSVLLTAASALAATWVSAVADVTSDMTALRDELDARIAAENFGSCASGPRGTPSPVIGARDQLQAMIDGGSTAQLLAVLRQLATCYAGEYKAGTPGDLSDLTDPLTSSVVAEMRADLVTRLEFIDGQIDLGKSCGHRGNPQGAKHLVAMSKLGHSKLRAADAAATEPERFRILDAVLWSGRSLVWREEVFGDYPGYGWLPPDDGVVSRLSCRFAPAGPALGATDGEQPPDDPNYGLGTMTASLSAGVLTVHATFTDDWTGGFGDGGPQPIIDLDLVVNGVTDEGKYGASAIQTGTVILSTYVGDDDETGDPLFDEDVYDVQGGSLKVVEFCSERVSGVFTLRFKARAADSETGDDRIFTLNKGKFSVYTGD